MSLFVQQNSAVSDFTASGSWVVLNPIEQSIKEKIEKVGIPLKDWDINIYRGILTGYNDAFIISEEKKKEILANCLNEDERRRTDELIRPILRGRDIKRYGYEYADLYLIATFPSRNYDIEQYPAVKNYLLSFGIERLEQTGKEYTIDGEKIKARKKTNNKWFETQDSINYWEEFNKPKIVWGEISDKAKFAYDDNGKFIPEATTFLLTGKNLAYLFCILNSSFSEWFFSKIGTTTGVGTVRWKKYTIQELLIPSLLEDEIKNITNLVEMFLDKKISLTTLQETINTQIYKAIELNDEEIKCINAQT